MAGIAYYAGLRELGAGIVRVGPGSPALHWETIQQYKPTALVAVPSALLGLISFAKENQLNIHSASVRKVICIGENIRTPDLKLNSLAEKILNEWPISLLSTYASTEMQTAFTECIHGVGGHHHPELIIVEMLDENDFPVADGTPGEVVITTLGVEGMPLLRFKTGDIAIRYSEPCSCGRTTFRLSPLLGRKQHMIKFKGTTCYPQSVVDVIQQIKEVDDYVIEVYQNELGTDELRVYLSGKNNTVLEDMTDQIKLIFKDRLRVVPEIRIADQRQISLLQEKGISRKLKKVIDNRMEG
jgi:phenylacetate-CoA ligase